MGDPQREFRPIRIREWLTGWMCLDTKIGLGLVLAGGLLLWLTDWHLPGIDWSIGYLVLITGVFFSVGSLGRDCRVVWRRYRQRSRHKPNG